MAQKARESPRVLGYSISALNNTAGNELFTKFKTYFNIKYTFILMRFEDTGLIDTK